MKILCSNFMFVLSYKHIVVKREANFRLDLIICASQTKKAGWIPRDRCSGG